MSRSRKKTPIFNRACCWGKKRDRTLANRLFRRKEKEILAKLEETYDSEIIFEKVAEVSDIWSWDCDGWFYWHAAQNKDFRK